MKLREYQQEASDNFYDALKSGFNPVVQAPTGSGKSLIIADVCKRVVERGGRVLVATHVQELILQNSATYERYTGDTPGVVSAGLDRNDSSPAVVFAGIQSIYRQGERFADRDLVLVDEAHLVPATGSDAVMYPQFLKDCKARAGGFTATPWRLDGGAIYGDGKLFDLLCYQKSPIELVEDGWLAPLVGFEASWQLDTKGITKTAGDFSQGAVAKHMEEKWLIEVLTHAITHLKGRKHVLVFAPTVATAQTIQRILTMSKQTCGIVTGDCKDREDQLTAWKAGEVRFMVNVEVLVAGFDFPALDSIIALRPTQSSGLWIQSLGRGMRIADGKKNCLVLDYVGNLKRLGGVGVMETWQRQMPDGKTQTAGLKPVGPTKVKIAARTYALTDIDPMLDSKGGLPVRVISCKYIFRPSKTPNVKLLIAVFDTETEDGFAISANSFVCVEHKGGARWHAERWFKDRGCREVIPNNAEAARQICYSLPVPRMLKLRRDGQYMNVIKEQF